MTDVVPRARVGGVGSLPCELERCLGLEPGAVRTGPGHSRSPHVHAARALAAWALHNHPHGPMWSYPEIAARLLRRPGAHASARGAALRVVSESSRAPEWRRVWAQCSEVFLGHRPPPLPPAVVVAAARAVRDGAASTEVCV